MEKHVLEKSFTHEFIDEVKYFKDGKETIALTLTVKAPSMKIIAETTILTQEYKIAQMKAMKIARESFGVSFDENAPRPEIDKSKKSEVETPEAIIETLLLGSADMMKCYFALKHILTLKVSNTVFALLDDTEKMTNNIFDEMSPTDANLILGKYIQTFITASQSK